MNDSVNSQGIGSLDDLEKTAKEAAEELNKASGHNAIWDKAAKALKPGLADLGKIRDEAKKEALRADNLVKDLEDNYDSDASEIVRKIRTAVDGEIKQLWENMSSKEQAFNRANDAAAAAKKALDESTAKFDTAQKDLLGVSKTIQDQQKQIVALESEVKDADTKHQLVEAVVKLEDLKKKLWAFNEVIKPEYEAAKWTALNAAANDLLAKTDALPTAQTQVPPAEEAYKAAKTEYENAVKNRLDTIKQRLADEESSSEGSAYETAAAR
jgi:chromosome segregation ATPase